VAPPSLLVISATARATVLQGRGGRARPSGQLSTCGWVAVLVRGDCKNERWH
jgi:hypothetical protein